MFELFSYWLNDYDRTGEGHKVNKAGWPKTKVTYLFVCLLKDHVPFVRWLQRLKGLIWEVFIDHLFDRILFCHFDYRKLSVSYIIINSSH